MSSAWVVLASTAVEAFVAMIRDPAYREAVKHRQAAVEDSRLIRLKPQHGGVEA